MKFLKTFASSKSHFAAQSLLCSSITLHVVPESFQWLKTLYTELWRRAKKNHQPNTNFVRTLFSQNAARHLLKITIPHILHFIYKIICSPDCCPARALKMCFENTSVPWKTQENLKRKQGNNPNNFLLHLLIKPSIYSDQNLFASNWKGIQAQSFSTLCSHSHLQVLSLLIYSQPPAAVHGQQLTASPLLTGRILSWNTVYSHRHYHNLI